MTAFTSSNALPLNVAEPARDHVINNGPMLHAALSTPSFFDYQRAEFKSRNPKLDLEEALRRYQRAEGKSALIDLNRVWTWDDILDEVEKAQGSYLAAGQGIKGIIRRGFRKIGDLEPAINPWVDFIPSSNNYLSVLCAGLRLILAAAGQMATKRKQVLESFGRVPEIIEMANQKRRIFPTDVKLRELAISLHYSLVDAIAGMIEWLLEKSRKKHFGVIFAGENAAGVIDNHVAKLEAKISDLRNWVDNLLDRSITESTTRLRRAEPQLNRIREAQIGMQIQAENISDGIGKMNESMRTIAQKTEAGVESQNGFFGMIAEQLRNAEWQNRRIEEYSQTLARHSQTLAVITAAVTEIRDGLPTQLSVTYISTRQLYQSLGVDKSLALQDLELVLKESSSIDPICQNQSLALIQSQQFRNWLSGRESALLLVDVGCTSDALERISATSVLCATLLRSLPNTDQVAVSIHFFCGLHTALADPLRGPNALVRSLIVQVLAYQDFDLRFVDSQQYYEALHQQDLHSLCKTFQSLVHQISASRVIFCVIDGIAFYENEGWLDDLSYVLEKLRELTIDHNTYRHPVFKLLITSAHTRRHINWQVAPGNLIETLDDSLCSGEEFIEREVSFQLDAERNQFASLRRDAYGSRPIDFDDSSLDYDNEKIDFMEFLRDS